MKGPTVARITPGDLTRLRVRGSGAALQQRLKITRESLKHFRDLPGRLRIRGHGIKIIPPPRSFTTQAPALPKGKHTGQHVWLFHKGNA